MKKIKIQINRPEPTSKEINSMQNFSSVLGGAKALAHKPWYTKASWLKGIGGGIAFVSIVALLLSIPEKKSGEEISDNNIEVVKETEIAQEVMPEIELQVTDEISPVNVEGGRLTTEVTSFSKKQKRRKNQGGGFEQHEIFSEKGGKIITKKNSWIKIPAGIFRKKNNEKVTGKVKVFTREFHDALDIAMSGIPMEYDSSGARHLQSAGMIEIWAVQNGDTLMMEKGKSMQVSLVSNTSSKSYNLYYLNPANENWQYLGKDSVSEGTQLVTERFSASDLMRESMNGTMSLPVVPRKKDKSRYRFNIDVDLKEFPELTEFNGMFFEVEPSDTNFTPAFYKIQWNDILLSSGEGTRNYMATFSQRISLLEDFPTISYDKDLYKADPAYKRMVDGRKGNVISSSFRVFPVYDKTDSVKVWKVYNARLAERKKQQDDALRAEEERQREYEKNMSVQQKASSQIYRTFNAMNFGVYNCDQIYRMTKRTRRIINMATADGTRIGTGDYVQLVDKTANSVISYYTNEITYNPDNENMILITRADGSLAYSEPSRFKEFEQKPAEQKLEVRIRENNFADAVEMKKFLEELK